MAKYIMQKAHVKPYDVRQLCSKYGWQVGGSPVSFFTFSWRLLHGNPLRLLCGHIEEFNWWNYNELGDFLRSQLDELSWTLVLLFLQQRGWMHLWTCFAKLLKNAVGVALASWEDQTLVSFPLPSLWSKKIKETYLNFYIP